MRQGECGQTQRTRERERGSLRVLPSFPPRQYREVGRWIQPFTYTPWACHAAAIGRPRSRDRLYPQCHLVLSGYVVSDRHVLAALPRWSLLVPLLLVPCSLSLLLPRCFSLGCFASRCILDAPSSSPPLSCMLERVISGHVGGLSNEIYGEHAPKVGQLVRRARSWPARSS